MIMLVITMKVKYADHDLPLPTHHACDCPHFLSNIRTNTNANTNTNTNTNTWLSCSHPSCLQLSSCPSSTTRARGRLTYLQYHLTPVTQSIVNCSEQRGIFVPRLHNIQRNTVKGIINAGILSSSHRMSSALSAVLLLCAIPKWRNRTMKKTMPRKAVDTKRKVPGNKSTVAL